MLFAYTYVPHKMEKMQEFIDFIFHEVWSKAPTEEYGLHLFEPEPSGSLHQIMEELHRYDLAGKLKEGAGKWFYETVSAIFIEFKTLDNAGIQQLHVEFIANNTIDNVCSGAARQQPVRYSDLSDTNDVLNAKLEDFYKNLYSSGFFSLKFVRNAIGADLSEFYADFVRKNNWGTCPFCGLQPIDNEFDPTREAFDHYLPKSKYPFNSVNLKNLAPSCNKCNSGNKRDKDPLHDNNNNRRKAFYPFSKVTPDIKLSVSILDKSWSPLTPDKLSITIASGTHDEEVRTWNDLFKIERRYLARCCDQSGGVHWLNRIFNECQNYNLSVQDMLAAEMQSAANAPWIEANFLKKAFLEGCAEEHLFDT